MMLIRTPLTVETTASFHEALGMRMQSAASWASLKAPSTSGDVALARQKTGSPSEGEELASISTATSPSSMMVMR